jgi:radical SAM superfamily enzyme with C-terminal helix-hairpin-helix motif
MASRMRALVLDGYTDEPACLGVPPFISPYARLAYGALASAGADVGYATIDQWRAGAVDFSGSDLLAVIRHVAVPGKYLRGMPASERELLEIGEGFPGRSVLSLSSSGSSFSRGDAVRAFGHAALGDIDAGLHDLVASGCYTDRRRTEQEWNTWLLRGAEACSRHPDSGGPLTAEVQMSRGCVRYISGGCRFCTEPLHGEIVFREPGDILAEVEALGRAGVRHFRLGAQSCVYSYKAKGVGETETPTPSPDMVTKLLRGISERVRPRVLHLDNANPAVIAAHPEEAREVTKAIVEHCTGGNVLALGLESADPKVGRANNLNADAEQTLAAIRLVNDLGAATGPTGLPMLLPGINFLAGLEGETKETFRLNLDFLRTVLSEGLLLRRTNIRQVIASRQEFPGVRSKREFSRFKRQVRQEIDLAMLARCVPDGTLLRSVYTELREGGRTFGRQVGTYPILVGMPYPVNIDRWVDVAVTGRGPKSVIGIVHPTAVNSASLSMLEAVPGIGRRRAMAIVRGRPYRSPKELWDLLGDDGTLTEARLHLTLDDAERE